MQALVYKGPHSMDIEQIESPTEPGPGMVLIQVKAVGICGSDIHGYTGESGRRTPGMVMGHEFAGVVHETGPGVENVRSGDRVTVNPLLTCGECVDCRTGNQQTCRTRKTIGVNTGRAGAFSEYVLAPAPNAILLAEDITLAEGLMAEPLAVGMHAARLAAPETGQPMLVLGGGTIGLCAMLSCLQLGATPVFVTELVPHKLQVIAALGGKPLDAGSTDLLALAGQVTGGRGFSKIIDAVAASSTIKQALPALAPRGTLVLVGLASPAVEFGLYDLVTQERVMRGSYAFNTDDFGRAAELINTRQVDVRPLLGEKCSLAEAAEMFERKAAGEIDTVKVVVEV